jgi:hypothetical protein
MDLSSLKRALIVLNVFISQFSKLGWPQKLELRTYDVLMNGKANNDTKTTYNVNMGWDRMSLLKIYYNFKINCGIFFLNIVSIFQSCENSPNIILILH